MAETIGPASARAKLALSRAELLAAMGFQEIKGEIDEARSLQKLPRPESTTASGKIGARLSHSMLGHWWRRHPLSSAFDLGQPLLAYYAHRHPAKLVAYGAGTGALLWVIKPWRLLSAATVITLLLKSSDLTGIVAGVLQRTIAGKDDGAAQSGGAPYA
jgi:hypothetical protein